MLRLLRLGLPEGARSHLVNVSYASLTDEERDEVCPRLQIASMHWSLRHLARRGFQPRSIIDIGACSGEWTRDVKSVFPKARVLMIEARQAEERNLQATAKAYGGEVDYVVSLLGAASKASTTFYLTLGGTGSSVLPENSDVPRQETSLSMTTLDELAARSGFESAEFLKLDVQGYELEVLQGGQKALAVADVVLMEISVWQYNRGAPLLRDVVNFMWEHGFRTYDICSFIRRPQDHVLLQTDVIFVKAGSPLLADEMTRYSRAVAVEGTAAGASHEPRD